MISPFDPFTVGPLTLRNRFIKSGANEAMSRHGSPTKALLKHHSDLARGGVALTTVAYGAVSHIGRTLEHQIVMEESVLPDLRAVTDAVHAEGGAASIQITHGGSFVTGLKVGTTMSSSSGINKAGLLNGNLWQRAMNEKDMQQIIDEFVAAAKIARQANFDAVEIHMGHGYLLNQYISPLSNKRRDEYGGSAKNRARFPARVLKAVKESVGKELAVLAKINVADGVKGGATAEDGMVTAQQLELAGADMLVLSGGRNMESTWFMFGSPINQEAIGRVLKSSPISRMLMKVASLSTPKNLKFKEMYFREYSLKIRQSVKLPLAYLGGVKSLENAQQAIDDGFECIVLARALIHDTQLVNKFKSGEATRSGCTNCNACVAYIYHPGGTWCIENPPNDLSLNEIPASQIN